MIKQSTTPHSHLLNTNIDLLYRQRTPTGVHSQNIRRTQCRLLSIRFSESKIQQLFMRVSSTSIDHRAALTCIQDLISVVYPSARRESSTIVGTTRGGGWVGGGPLGGSAGRFTSFTWADFERGSATWTVSSGGSRQEFLSMFTLAFIAASSSSSSASRVLLRRRPPQPPSLPRATASPRSPRG